MEMRDCPSECGTVDTYGLSITDILLALPQTQMLGGKVPHNSTPPKFIIIIIIMAGMAVFNVASYLIEEKRRWPVITASPRGQCSK